MAWCEDAVSSIASGHYRTWRATRKRAWRNNRPIDPARLIHEIVRHAPCAPMG